MRPWRRFNPTTFPIHHPFRQARRSLRPPPPSSAGTKPSLSYNFVTRRVGVLTTEQRTARAESCAASPPPTGHSNRRPFQYACGHSTPPFTVHHPRTRGLVTPPPLAVDTPGGRRKRNGVVSGRVPLPIIIITCVIY